MCGRTVGSAGGLGGSMHLVAPEVGLLPTFAIVGAGLPVACGAAIAARARKTDRVAVAIFGDGAANIGAFHESLNFAAIRKLPVVFVCENNLYGEYTRIQLSTPVEDIASRAASYAMPGVVVDGQDADKVAEAMSEAVSRARRGEGPTLVETKTYRYSGHSRSDPATYRPAGELDQWLERDPVNIFADRLVAEAKLTSEERSRLQVEVREDVEKAAAEALAAPQPAVEEMLLHVDAASSPTDRKWNFWS
jgi:pyruvate dehydrogenase E1 component alpha subunit